MPDQQIPLQLRQEKTIQQRFERFHIAHPEVLEELIGLARQWRRAGHDHGAIEVFWAVLRWQRGMRGLPDDDEDYKLNDHYTSRYARLIMERCSDLDGVFEVRRLRA